MGTQGLSAVWRWFQAEAEKFALSNPLVATKDLWEAVRQRAAASTLQLNPEWLFNNQYHLIIEICLVIAIVYLLTQSRAPAKTTGEALTEEEIDALVEEWKPQPLVPEKKAGLPIKTPIIDEIVGSHVTIDGVSGILHLASYNFWGLSGDSVVQAENAKALAHYGVGACGPRGFYGSIDSHIQLEEQLAAFMGCAEAIVYSFDIATMPSVLPAFASRKDILVLDRGASWPLRNGANLSKAKVYYFNHNDVEDLERVLRKIVDQGRHRPLTRRFIVTEGIFHTSGSVAPLREIHRLKQQYKFRLIVDESLSFGVCGARGRGACEAAGLAPGQVEIITGSLGTGLASAGGFCVGSQAMVDHQRLSGSGYVFSASALPVLTASASATLRRFLELHKGAGGGPGGGVQGGLLRDLAAAARALRTAIAKVPDLRLLDSDCTNGKGGEGGAGAGGEEWVPPVAVVGLADKHILFAGQAGGTSGAAEGEVGASLGVEAQVSILAKLREQLISERAALVDLQRPSCLDEVAVSPALRMSVTVSHTIKDIEAFGLKLKQIAARVTFDAASGTSSVNGHKKTN